MSSLEQRLQGKCLMKKYVLFYFTNVFAKISIPPLAWVEVVVVVIVVVVVVVVLVVVVVVVVVVAPCPMIFGVIA